jgi:hypothetical protein
LVVTKGEAPEGCFRLLPRSKAELERGSRDYAAVRTKFQPKIRFFRFDGQNSKNITILKINSWSFTSKMDRRNNKCFYHKIRDGNSRDPELYSSVFLV